MRIAVCSLSEFTHVAEFLDASERLATRHDVLQFVGWERPAASSLLRERQIPFEVLLEGAGRVPEVGRGTQRLFADYFFAHAEAMLPPLLRRLEAFRPDVVLSHLRDYGGITAAELTGTPVVTFGSHASPHRVEGLDAPFGAGLAQDAPSRHRALAWRVHRAFDAAIDPEFNRRLRQPFGLADISGASTQHSRQLVLLSLLPSLAGKSSPEPPHVRYVGSLFSGTHSPADDDEMRALDAIARSPRPRLFVSLGTTYAALLLERSLEALESFAGTLVVAVGTAAVHDPGRNRIARPFFQHVHAVLEQCDAVLSVAAGKTVLDALRHGRPLVCLPQQGEQKEIAVALAGRGAALLPCRRRWDPSALLSAAERVCAEPSFAKAAGVLRQEMQGLGGPDAAVAAIEVLAR